MDINLFIPPLLQPYKAWIALALFCNAYFIVPSMPVPKKQGWYSFLYNVLARVAGQYGHAAPEPLPTPIPPTTGVKT